MLRRWMRKSTNGTTPYLLLLNPCRVRVNLEREGEGEGEREEEREGEWEGEGERVKERERDVHVFECFLIYCFNVLV